MWFVLDGRSGFILQVEQWGLPGDVVRAADFDSDGRADKVVWRPGMGIWFVHRSGGVDLAVQWGLTGDVPVPGTYSGSAVDYAVYRPANATLYVLSQSGAVYSKATGMLATDQVLGVKPYSAVQ